jgi:hypothetical protein
MTAHQSTCSTAEPSGARRWPRPSIAEPVRAAVRTAVFFLEVLPMLPSRPVDWVTAPPLVERVRYPTPWGEIEGQLYRPSTPGRHPGVVVCLGVVPFGVDHPQVPRLGAALARAGFAALLYWSPAMRDLRLDPEDVSAIAMAYQWLVEQSFMNSGSSGLLGTCVGGSFALMAASDPAIRDAVSFVVAWAPYGSMRTLGRDIAREAVSSEGGSTPWQVDQLTRKVYVRSLTAMLEPREAERLRTACAERDGRVDERALSADGQAVYPLLTDCDAPTAEMALKRLPAAMQERLDALSPLTALHDLRAPLVVLAHDRDDAVVPIGESRRLAAALTGRPGVHYTEFRMFKHLDPTKVQLPIFALARELAKFVRAVYPIFRAAVIPMRG